jgi:hypothetical protein
LNTDGRGCVARSLKKSAIKRHRNGIRGPRVAGTLNATHEGISRAMADVNDEQPAFDIIAGAMNDISRSQAILATHFEKMPNIPAVDGGAQILAEIRALRTEMGVHFVDLEYSWRTSGYNWTGSNWDSGQRERPLVIPVM